MNKKFVDQKKIVSFFNANENKDQPQITSPSKENSAKKKKIDKMIESMNEISASKKNLIQEFQKESIPEPEVAIEVNLLTSSFPVWLTQMKKNWRNKKPEKKSK